ncbi:MAG: hypothetical protein H6850_01595 [Alphaproteobacteria bacterium]|nr:MAG: hypothetical protein H6850_01595 [Alphaproteobacteria bacterium]
MIEKYKNNDRHGERAVALAKKGGVAIYVFLDHNALPRKARDDDSEYVMARSFRVVAIHNGSPRRYTPRDDVCAYLIRGDESAHDDICK